jgi:hypothetical protein
MGKGKVIGINTGQQGGTTGISTTVTPPGGGGLGGSFTQPSSTPPGTVMIGTIQDAANPQLNVTFTQPFGAELGLVIGAKVNYQTVTINGQLLANSVRLLQRGEVLTLDPDDNGGTLLDKANGVNMQFCMVNTQESGIVVGSKVHFETVISPLTALPVAVAIELIGG